MNKHTLKDLIQDNWAIFTRYREGILYYNIYDHIDPTFEALLTDIPIPVEDLKGAELRHTEKASTIMKWIRIYLAQVQAKSA